MLENSIQGVSSFLSVSLEDIHCYDKYEYESHKVCISFHANLLTIHIKKRIAEDLSV